MKIQTRSKRHLVEPKHGRNACKTEIQTCLYEHLTLISLSSTHTKKQTHTALIA